MMVLVKTDEKGGVVTPAAASVPCEECHVEYKPRLPASAVKTGIELGVVLRRVLGEVLTKLRLRLRPSKRE